MAAERRMTFRRYARSYHLKITTAEDLAYASGLDEALWVATSAPVDGISCDPTFLRLLDTDNSGRITCHELAGAADWLLAVLCDREPIERRSDQLDIETVDTETPQGRAVREAAAKMLARAGRPQDKAISLEQVRRIKAEAEATGVSEAGVVLPEAATDARVRRFIADIVSATGGVPHPSGKAGIDKDMLEKFLADAAALADWYAAGRLPAGQEKTDILPLGDGTSGAYEALAAVRGKIDQYFAQCEAAALDERFTQRMGWTEAELEGLDFDDPGVIEDVLRKAPLAKARSDRILDLSAVNPYYSQPLARFEQKVLQPVLGRTGSPLTARQWQEVKSFFAVHRQWLEAKPDSPVEALGREKLEGYLDPHLAEAADRLIAESATAALELGQIRMVEKVILYQMHLMDLANNFVAFPHLYDPASRAMFEVGSLVMDGRRFNLAVNVANRSQHAELARSSNIFVMYVRITGPGRASREVAVPVTAGGKGNLTMGKRGIFHDIAANELDAEIVQIIENPISLPEAMACPFRRLGRLITGKIEALTTQAEKKLDATASAALSGQIVRPAAQQQATPQSRLAAGGMLMGAGVALAAMGSAVAYIAKTLSEASWLAVVIAVGAALLLVALPTSVVAFLKLRRRDLSAILEGAGWAINAPLRLTRKQANYFTQRPALPKGARGVRRPGRLILAGAVLAALLAVAAWLVSRHLAAALEPAATTSHPATTQPA